MRIRPIITILIVCAALSILITATWWKFGIFSKFNYFAAKRDISKGKVHFVSFGLPLFSSKDQEIEAVRHKYGFKSYEIGCTVTQQEINGIEYYNKAVEEYLEARNGKNWRIRFDYEVDSLYKIAFNR